MELTPRYDDPPVLRWLVDPGDPSVPLVRQRRRLVALAAGLDPEQWAAPSRCAGWSVGDVLTHLSQVDGFWALAASEALAGRPTRLLRQFDPVSTPAAMVAGTAGRPQAEVVAELSAGVEGFTAVVADLDPERWQVAAEAPPGHVPLHALVAHALWDAWVHERDIVLPLGLEPVVEADEVAVSLRYVAALGPALRSPAGPVGTFVIDGTDPDVHLVVETGPTVVVGDGPAPDGATRLAGPSVDLVEALSVRAPLPAGLSSAEVALLGGLALAFDQA